MVIKKHFQKGERVIDLLQGEKKHQYICASINGKVENLDYVFFQDMDATVDFMDVKDSRASRIYQTSLRFLLAMAVRAVDPKLDVRFFYNISRTVFARVFSRKGVVRVNSSFVRKVDEKMKEFIQEDIPLERMKVSKKEALSIYKKMGYKDKAKILSYRKEDYVHIYHAKAEDMDYYDYLYDILVPSASYLKNYKLIPYNPGFLIQYPRADYHGEIPPFSDEIKFAISLASTSSWAEKNHLDTVTNINRFIKSYGAMPLINVAESRVNDMLHDLADEILKRDQRIRMIPIAGPSSSGKTSFANRLVFELMARGLRPIRVSCDDFYIPRKELKPGQDIEAVDALDIPLLNKTMNQLINGEKVRLPIYDFKTGLRSFGKPLSIEENQPIIMEGIHALNPLLTEEVPAVQKFKVFISPQPQVNLDNHTPLSMSDMRLLRRISRDYRTRNSSAEETIAMWPNVRGGEFKYVYPTQENADFVFDSFLPYELSAMRNIVLPLLEEIPLSSPAYVTATRLRQMVKYFLPIGLSDIPCNSLMREFVGGSSFKDAR